MLSQPKIKIVVIGGYGNVGRRICTLLADNPAYHILVAGRDKEKAERLAAQLNEKAAAEVKAYPLDWQSNDFPHRLKESQAQIVIHAAGPFQGQSYKVASTCIDLKKHYIDLADAREFVTRIVDLDEKAKAQNVAVISGASVAPGLTSAVVENFANRFAILREIHIGIAPPFKMEKGRAHFSSILGHTGKPFQRLEKGTWKTVYGWQNLHRHYYGDNIGMRWQASVDVPDLTLLPQKYPMLQTVVFHAGLEIAWLHWALWQLSWLSRINFVKNWSTFHKLILSFSQWFSNFGTDMGGMTVRLYGSNCRYQPLEVIWTLVAERGYGSYLPAVPSLILVNKILQKEISYGAQPCLGLFTLNDFDNMVSTWPIYYTLEETES